MSRRDRFRFVVTATLCVALLSTFVGSSLALSLDGGTVPFLRPGGLGLPVADASSSEAVPEAADSELDSDSVARTPSTMARSIQFGDIEWSPMDAAVSEGGMDLAGYEEEADESDESDGSEEAPVSPGDVIVRFAPAITDAEVTLIAARSNCTIIGHIGSTYRFRVNSGSLAGTILALRAESGTVYAEPDWAELGNQARIDLAEELMRAAQEGVTGSKSTGSSLSLAEQQAALESESSSDGPSGPDVTSPDAPGESDETVHITGTLTHVDLEGGFYAVVGDGGEGFAVIANPGAFMSQLLTSVGRTVTITGTRFVGVSLRMAGPEIVVQSITVAPQDGESEPDRFVPAPAEQPQQDQVNAMSTGLTGSAPGESGPTEPEESAAGPSPSEPEAPAGETSPGPAGQEGEGGQQENQPASSGTTQPETGDSDGASGGSVSAEQLEEARPASSEPPLTVPTVSLGGTSTSYTDDDGVEQQIDSAVVSSVGTGFDYENAANDFRVFFREAAPGDALLLVQRNGWRFGYSLEGANLSDALVEGNVITFRNIFPGVDIRYTVSADAIKEDLILHELVDRDTYSFALDTEGLSFERNSDGSLTFTELASGNWAFDLSAPIMFDSSAEAGGMPAASMNIGMVIRRAGDGYVLDLMPDMAWVGDSSRVFPVIIDPTFSMRKMRAVQDTFVNSAAGYTGTNYEGHTYAGVPTVGFGQWGGAWLNTYIQFDTSFLAGAQILYAGLDLFCLAQLDTGWSPYIDYYVAPALSPWNESTLTWNNRPFADLWWSSFGSVNGGQWTNTNVTQTLQRVGDGGSDFGLIIAPWTWVQGDFGYFVSSEASSLTPTLHIEYARYPTVTAKTPDNVVFTTSTPKLEWDYKDSNGYPLSFSQIQVWAKSDFADADYCVVDTSVGAAEFVLPNLEDGTYYWRVYVYNGILKSQGWSAVRTFTVRAYHSAEVTGVSSGILPAGVTVTVPVEVRNTGERIWVANGTSLFRVVADVYDSTGTILLAGGFETGLPYDLPSGQSVRIDAMFTTPTALGSSYRLKVYVRMPDGTPVDPAVSGPVYDRAFTVQATYNATYSGRAPPMVFQNETSVTTEVVTVTNTAATALSASGITLGYRIVDRYGAVIASNTAAGALTGNIAQNASLGIAAQLTVADTILPGSYQLIWDLYSATDGWLSAKGVRPLTVLLQVRVFGTDDARPFVGPVDLTSGNLVLSSADASIAGSGPALGVTRTYNSLDPTVGSFGLGFSSNLDMRVQVVVLNNVEYVVMWGADGSRHVFTRKPDGTYLHPAGVYVTLTRNPDGTYSVETPDFTVYRYASPAFDVYGAPIAGSLAITSITDRFGQSVIYGRNASGKVEQLTRGAEHSIQIAYNAAGFVSRVFYQVNNFNGQVGAEVTVETAYGYSGSKLASVTADPAGLALVTTLTYNSSNRLKSVTSPGDSTDPIDRTTSYTYWAERLYTITTPPSSGTTQPVTQFDRGEDRQSAFVRDPAGNYTDYCWNSRGNLFWTHDPAGLVTRLYWNDFNDLIASVAGTNATVHEYDGAVRRQSYAGALIQYSYWGGPALSAQPVRGNVTTTYTIDQSAHVWMCEKYTFDSLGRPLTGKDKDGASITIRYDSEEKSGNPVSAVNSLGDTAINIYDQFGHVVGTVPAASEPDLVLYDPFDVLASAWDIKSTSTTSSISLYTDASSPVPSPAPKMISVWQFYKNGYHFYTESEGEYTSCLQSGWTYQGVVYTYDPLINTSWVARLVAPDGWNHMYTVSSEEVTILVNAGWTYEGGALRHAGGSGSAFPIYRSYGPNNDHYFSTSSVAPSGYTLEGVAWYVAQTPKKEVQQLSKTGSSLRISQTVDDGDTYVSRTFDSALNNHVVEASFFDGGTATGTWWISVSGSEVRRVGLNTAVSSTMYCYEYNGTWTVGSVARSAGWHRVSFRVDSTGIRTYIDGDLLFSTNGSGKTITSFSAGTLTTISQPLALDDFKVYVAPVLRGGDFEGAGDWTQYSTPGTTGGFGTGSSGRLGGEFVWVHQTSTSGEMGYKQGLTLTSQTRTVWQLYKDGYHFYTESEVEKSICLNADWQLEGPLYSYDPTLNTVPVVRLAKGSAHYYTTDAIEVAIKVSEGWISETTGLWAAAGIDSTYAIYEFSADRGAGVPRDYFYSVSSAVPSGYIAEGLAWRVAVTRISDMVMVVPGETYTLSGYARVSEVPAGESSTARLEVRDGTTGAVLFATPHARELPDTDSSDRDFYLTTMAAKDAAKWQPLQVTFTVPAGVTSVTVHALVSGRGLACFDDVTLEISRSTRVVYDTSGNYPVQVIGADGQVVRYEYDSVGRVVRNWTLLGDTPINVVTTEYDVLGRVVAKRDDLGGCTTVEYANAGRTVTTTTTLNATESAITITTYNPYGKVLTSTDPDGTVTHNLYDVRGLLIQTRVVSPQGAEVAKVSYEYDAAGRCVSVTKTIDGQGRTSTETYEFDTLGRVTTQTDALGNPTSYEYDAFGRVTKETDALGNAVYYTYSGGKLVGVTKAMAAAEAILIDAFETLNTGVWTVAGTNPPSVDSSRHREGSASIKTATGISSLTHTFVTAQTDCTLEVAFFDEQLDTAAIQIAVTGNGVVSALEMSGSATGTYIWRVGAQTANATAIPRTKGWHTVKFVVDSGGTDCYLDGRLVGYSASSEVTRISLGSSAAGNASPAYFDDFRMYTTAQAGQFSRGKNVASRNESALAGVVGNGFAPKLIDGVTSFSKTAIQFTQVMPGAVGTMVVLEAVAALSGIDVYFNDLDATPASYSYRLDVSDDGQTWKTVASGTARSWLQLRFAAPVPARMIRVVNTAASGNLAIGEIQAWVSPLTTSSSYDSEGQLVAQTDGLGNTTRLMYNNEGQLVWRTDARGNADVMTYDRSGRMVKTADSLGNTVTVRYDAAGRRVSVTDQLGRDASTVYDSLSRVIETISVLNHRTSAVHDLAGRVTSMTETTLRSDGGTAGVSTVARTYSAGGKVTSVTNALGQVTYYEYDALGRVTKVTDARGYEISSTYLMTGQAETSTNQVGVVTRYTYDDTGRLIATSVDDTGLALTTRFSYDALGRLTQVTDARGASVGDPNYTTSYTYDARGNMTSRTDTNGTTTFAYDAVDRLISRTDPVGNTIYYRHDADGNIIGITSPNQSQMVNVAGTANGGSASGTNGDRWSLAIDGNSTVYDGGNGYAYTFWNTNPQGSMTFTLPSLCAVERVRMRLWDLDTRFYRYKVYVSADQEKWDLVVDKTSGEWRSWQEDSFAARPVKYIKVVGTYNSSPDNAGFHIVEFEAYVDRAKTGYVYDAENRLTHQTDALGRYITHAYDAKGRRVSTVYPAGSTLPMDGTTVTYQYDAGDRLIGRTQTGAVVVPQTAYEYDSGGNMTYRSDASGAYSYTYDAADRLTYVHDSAGVELARYTYDPNGNCLSKTVTLGGVTLVTAYTYDECNRMTTQVATQGGVTVQDLTYTYLSTGQVQTRTDVVGATVTTTTYTYDAAGQLVSEAIAQGATVTVRSYTYDGSGNRTSVSESSYSSVTAQETNANVTYYGTWTSRTGASYSGGSDRYANLSGAGATIGFEGIRLEVLATTASNYGKARIYLDDVYVGDADLYSSTTKYQQVVWDTGALQPGWHTLRLEWTGTKNAASSGTTIALDAFKVMGTVAQAAARREQNAAGMTYTGTWTTVTNTSHSGSSIAQVNTSGAALVTTFIGAGFVLLASTGTGFGKARVYVDGVQTDLVDLYSASTRYQQAVLRKTLPYGTHTVMVEWTGTKYAKAKGTTINVDAIDVLAGEPAAPTPSQTLSFDAANRVVGFTYDARGNVLSDGTHLYTWDPMNRLTQVKLASTGALLASYGYDADGMRQTATVGGATTRFVVDAVSDEIVALLDSAGAVVSSFIRDAAGSLVAMVRSGAVFTYLTNAHGDVTALLNSAGTVVARWTYDAWGRPTEYNAAGTQVATGTAGNPFLYAGYLYDVATGLYYLRARYYDPGTGRFLSMDPEPGALTDRLSQNPYIYCQNDPVNLADPDGRAVVQGTGVGPRLTARQRLQAAMLRARRLELQRARKAAIQKAAAAKKPAAAKVLRSLGKARTTMYAAGLALFAFANRGLASGGPGDHKTPKGQIGIATKLGASAKTPPAAEGLVPALGGWLYGRVTPVPLHTETTETVSAVRSPLIVLRGDGACDITTDGVAKPNWSMSLKAGKTVVTVGGGAAGPYQYQATVDIETGGNMTKVTTGMKGLDSAFLRSTSGTYTKTDPALEKDGLYHTVSTYSGSGWQVDYHPARAQIAPAVIAVAAIAASGVSIPTLVIGVSTAVMGLIGI